MTVSIHPTAIVHDGAQLGADVTIGPFCIVGPQVTLKDRVALKSHVSVDGVTELGADCVVHPFACLGGPPQHLAQARMRAIEEGLPILRSTPNGISAVIAADGRLLGTVPHSRAGAIDLPMPRALPPTLFSRAGNWWAAIVAVLLCAAAVVIRRRAR